MVETNALSSRELILQRVRASLGDRPATPPVAELPGSAGRRRDSTERRVLVSRFLERAREYTAVVERMPEAALGARVAAICASENVRRLAHPAAIPDEWLPPGLELLGVSGEVACSTLVPIDAALTGCRLAIADTGTVVLDDGATCGPRALSLIPDVHVCVINEDQVVADVAHALARLDPKLPTTWVSGPSATSDIELSRVEGVHGPRRLWLLLLA